LFIVSPPIEFKENVEAVAEDKELMTCCCTKQGKSNFTVVFNKNTFYSNETAHASVTIDNSHSKLKVKAINFKLRQFTYTMGHFEIFDIHESKYKVKIGAGDGPTIH
jgi:hypothetical protein